LGDLIRTKKVGDKITAAELKALKQQRAVLKASAVQTKLGARVAATKSVHDGGSYEASQLARRDRTDRKRAAKQAQIRTGARGDEDDEVASYLRDANEDERQSSILDSPGKRGRKKHACRVQTTPSPASIAVRLPRPAGVTYSKIETMRCLLQTPKNRRKSVVEEWRKTTPPLCPVSYQRAMSVFKEYRDNHDKIEGTPGGVTWFGEWGCHGARRIVGNESLSAFAEETTSGETDSFDQRTTEAFLLREKREEAMRKGMGKSSAAKITIAKQTVAMYHAAILRAPSFKPVDKAMETTVSRWVSSHSIQNAVTFAFALIYACFRPWHGKGKYPDQGTGQRMMNDWMGLKTIAINPDYIVNHDESTFHAVRDPKTGDVTSLARVTKAGASGKRRAIQKRPEESQGKWGTVGIKTLVGSTATGLFTPPFLIVFCTERDLPIETFPSGFVGKGLRFLTNDHTTIPSGKTPGYIVWVRRKVDADETPPARAVYSWWVRNVLLKFVAQHREANGYVDTGDPVPLEHRVLHMFDGDSAQVKATCNEMKELLIAKGVEPMKLPAADSLNVQLLDVGSGFKGTKQAYRKPPVVNNRFQLLETETLSTFAEWKADGT
jgi:hypothetical protein